MHRDCSTTCTLEAYPVQIAHIKDQFFLSHHHSPIYRRIARPTTYYLSNLKVKHRSYVAYDAVSLA